MGGVPADVTTNSNADEVGKSSGSEFKDITKEHLPDHEHDLKSPGGTQHYAILDNTVSEQNSINQPLNIAQGAQTTSGIPSSGSIDEGGTDGQGNYRSGGLGLELDIMPPFATVNYIIFADNA
jgi:hypothetical protein